MADPIVILGGGLAGLAVTPVESRGQRVFNRGPRG